MRPVSIPPSDSGTSTPISRLAGKLQSVRGRLQPLLAPVAYPAALLAMLVFAAVLSLLVFSRTSLRLDEAQSLFQTSRDLQGTLRLVAQDVHVPLYHILLHYWQRLFGGDIAAARMLSLCFYLLTILATYALGRFALSRRVGLFAALLITISPFMAWYGSEARMYAMLAFFTVLNQLMYLRFIRDSSWPRWLAYVLTAIAGIYTHYFFSFVLLTQLVFFLNKRRTFNQPRLLLKFSLAAVSVVACFAPWLYYVYSQGTASNTQPSLQTPSSGDLFNTYAQFIFGFQMDQVNTVIVSMWPILVLLAFFALQKNSRIPRSIPFFVASAVLPVAAAFIISVTLRPFYLSRYLIVALPALLVFISWMLTQYPPRLRRFLQTGLTVIILAMMAIQVISPNTPVKEDYAAAVQYLNRNTSSQDIVIASAPFTIYPIEYYYRGDAKLTTQPAWNRFESGSIPGFDKQTLAAETKAITGQYRKAWVILSFDQGYNSDIKKYYDGNYEQLESRKFSQGLSVYTYKLRYDEPLKLKPAPEPDF